MRNDSGPDTIAIEETQWQHTQLDDVFLPSVRVQLAWKDVEAAVERGAVVPQKAHALWAGWASPTSGMRVGGQGVALADGASRVDPRHEDLTAPDRPGPLQRHGLVLGLVAGCVLGAAGAWLTLTG